MEWGDTSFLILQLGVTVFESRSKEMFRLDLRNNMIGGSDGGADKPMAKPTAATPFWEWSSLKLLILYVSSFLEVKAIHLLDLHPSICIPT